jgi:MoaA/NifB/PqqE/SkfB family radical SAM enzyme
MNIELDYTNKLFLIYSLKCNLSCTHCLVNAGKRNEKLELESAKQIILYAKDIGYKLIVLTGGELLVCHFDDTIELIKCSHYNNLYTILETNATWVESYENTCKTILKLKEIGLDGIATSYDIYREKKVKIEQIKNLFLATKENKLSFRLIVSKSNDDIKDNEIIQSLSEVGIDFDIEPLMIIGRGKILKRKYPNIKCMAECDSIGTTVLPNGDIYSCCGVNIDDKKLKDTKLYSGNINTENAYKILLKDYSKKIKRDIISYGHNRLWKDLYQENKMPFENICDNCYKIVSKQKHTGIHV